MQLRHALIIAALALIGLNLATVLWHGLGDGAGARLAEIALAQVPSSGVSNPVTSVLLNFRAYDTLLELAVLLAAILGIWSSGPAVLGFAPGEAVLRALTTLVVPLLIVAGGYLLWVGGHAPGGAFQAGALLAAAGVLVRLSGRAGAGLPPLPALRLLVTLGVSVFTLVALALMATGSGFLTYPSGGAKWLILGIEAAASLAIGATLAAACLAGEPPARVPREIDNGALPR